MTNPDAMKTNTYMLFEDLQGFLAITENNKLASNVSCRHCCDIVNVAKYINLLVSICIKVYATNMKVKVSLAVLVKFLKEACRLIDFP